MLPKLRSLAVFAKVAETGSFSAAANVLGISAPVVSQHISQLEETLDTALIYRSTRSLTLTEAGQRLAVHANNMLENCLLQYPVFWRHLSSQQFLLSL